MKYIKGEDDFMKILLVGNGFDLAHRLPTKYTDFLKFIKIIEQVVTAKNDNDLDMIYYDDVDPQVKSLMRFKIKNEKEKLLEQQQEWKSLIAHNFWLEYFFKVPMYKKENWIDFEYEISRVIQNLDADMREHGVSLDEKALFISNKYIEEFFKAKLPSGVAEGISRTGEIVSYKEIRDVLYEDLNKLIRAFERYLADYIEKMGKRRVSPEIKKLNIDHVLSFNYTHTYYRIYSELEPNKIEYDHVHGEACENREFAFNNMVLGIDEYLPEDRKNRDIDFIAFKKYYQRIYKATGRKYKHWIDGIRESEYSCKQELKQQYQEQVPYEKFTTKHHLYIFGHSLDVTDRDILRDLILNDSVLTTIFYCKKYDKNGQDDNGKQDLGTKIANLVKIIGQDELIRRTGGDTETIKFKLQEDMEVKENFR